MTEQKKKSMSKQLLSDCDLYKCKDCKHYIIAEFKRWNGKKPLVRGSCAIRNSAQDKSNGRLPNQYACKKFELSKENEHDRADDD
jgi:hypothetical protein